MNCRTCGQAITPDSAAAIEHETVEKISWNWWADYKVGYQHGRIKLEAKKLEFNDWQGSESDVWLVFEVHGRYFKKYGIADSYGNVNWGGLFEEVQPKTKTITVFE
ncbi:hypothetical protein [Saccharopolyspora pogona]|uniref:hypothetical protein n=1 Tax=Saccharopolyspora pogona TaxID=333966 RepID=UPI001688B665|nr:hypothetical protein [Saccharopolyspora pogona]